MPIAILLARLGSAPPVSVQDAVYVGLAEALDAPPITRDRRLSEAPGHTARVELV